MEDGFEKTKRIHNSLRDKEATPKERWISGNPIRIPLLFEVASTHELTAIEKKVNEEREK